MKVNFCNIKLFIPPIIVCQKKLIKVFKYKHYYYYLVEIEAVCLNNIKHLKKRFVWNKTLVKNAITTNINIFVMTI